MRDRESKGLPGPAAPCSQPLRSGSPTPVKRPLPALPREYRKDIMRVARERMSVFLLFLSALRVPLCFFERVSVPLRVAGLEYHPHPDLAQLLEDVVMRDGPAGHGGHPGIQIWFFF